VWTTARTFGAGYFTSQYAVDDGMAGRYLAWLFVASGDRHQRVQRTPTGINSAAKGI
jgi:hypothetical protein